MARYRSQARDVLPPVAERLKALGLTRKNFSQKATKLSELNLMIDGRMRPWVSFGRGTAPPRWKTGAQYIARALQAEPEELFGPLPTVSELQEEEQKLLQEMEEDREKALQRAAHTPWLLMPILSL